jgi:N-acetylmuramic acid 6-phosphate etherase
MPDSDNWKYYVLKNQNLRHPVFITKPALLVMLTTESPSHYNNLEKLSTRELLIGINQEDKTVPFAVEKAIPQIEALVNAVVERMQKGGRLFYIGAGTSGRLGVVDASECPPTYGVPHGLVVGIIAGGDGAIRKSVENAEDDFDQAWKDLQVYQMQENDTVIGIAASGRTPYVIGGLRDALAHGLVTGCVVCNAGSKVAGQATYPVEVVVGPEFVTGSTRMKSGTAQKLTLNMISTSVMIRLGKVKGNKMVDMQLSNEKLVDRGVRMVMDELNIGEKEAAALLAKHGSVRNAIQASQGS